MKQSSLREFSLPYTDSVLISDYMYVTHHMHKILSFNYYCEFCINYRAAGVQLIRHSTKHKNREIVEKVCIQDVYCHVTVALCNWSVITGLSRSFPVRRHAGGECTKSQLPEMIYSAHLAQ